MVVLSLSNQGKLLAVLREGWVIEEILGSGAERKAVGKQVPSVH